MKKFLLAATMASSILFAANGIGNGATIISTMKLMHMGMNMSENAFFYNDKSKMLKGIEIVQNANNIFSKINIKSFIHEKSISVAAVKNITFDLKRKLKELKKDISQNNISKAGKVYGAVLDRCITCHIIIRKW